MASKRCITCGTMYTGFGDTCASCRKGAKTGGENQECPMCGAHFWGFSAICDDCDPLLIEGWLHFLQGNTMSTGFCRLYNSRLDAWTTVEEADKGSVPSGTIALHDVVSWSLFNDSNEGDKFVGGFILNMGAQKRKAYLATREEYVAWGAQLGDILVCPITSTADLSAAHLKEGRRSGHPGQIDDKDLFDIHRIKKNGTANLQPKSYLKQTAACRQVNKVPLTLEVAMGIPIATEKLDAQAGRLLKSGKETAGVVAKVRSRLKTKAFQAHRAGQKAATDAANIDWKQFFKTVDKNHSGTVQWEEFHNMCRNTLGIVPHEASDAALRLVFRSLDIDDSEEIGVEELIAFVVDPVQRMHARMHAAVRALNGDEFELFKEQDQNSDGLVQWPEFLAMCRESLKMLDDESQLALVFRAFDVDQSGHIAPGEFIEFIRKKAPTADGLGNINTPIPGREEPKKETPKEYGPDDVIHQGLLKFEKDDRDVQGFCRLYKDRIDAWNSEDSTGGPEGSISFANVLSWRIHKESSGGKVVIPGFVLFCGEVHKKFYFVNPDEATGWTKAITIALGAPIESFTFQAWNPTSPTKAGAKSGAPGSPTKGKPAAAKTSGTTKGLAPQRDYAFGRLKDLFATPALTEELKKLDQDALASMKKADNRMQMLTLVARIRASLRDAAWSAGGSDWAKLFNHEDKDHSGQLDFTEFRLMCRRVLRLTKTAIPDTWLRVIFRSLDTDGNGELDLDELVSFVEDPLRRMRSRLLSSAPSNGDWSGAFAAMDKDNSGELDFEEFVQMCRNSFNVVDDETMLALVFDALDADSSGFVSCQELVDFVNTPLQMPEASKPAIARTKSFAQKWT